MAEVGKERKIPLRSDDSEIVAAIVADVKAALERKEKAKTQEEKLEAAQALEEAKANQKNVWHRFCCALLDCRRIKSAERRKNTCTKPRLACQV